MGNGRDPVTTVSIAHKLRQEKDDGASYTFERISTVAHNMTNTHEEPLRALAAKEEESGPTAASAAVGTASSTQPIPPLAPLAAVLASTALAACGRAARAGRTPAIPTPLPAPVPAPPARTAALPPTRKRRVFIAGPVQRLAQRNRHGAQRGLRRVDQRPVRCTAGHRGGTGSTSGATPRCLTPATSTTSPTRPTT